MAQGTIPYPRQLQRNGLVMLLIGLVGTVVLAVLHGGLEWMNVGTLFMVFGTVMILVGRVLQARARSRSGAPRTDGAGSAG